MFYFARLSSRQLTASPKPSHRKPPRSRQLQRLESRKYPFWTLNAKTRYLNGRQLGPLHVPKDGYESKEAQPGGPGPDWAATAASCGLGNVGGVSARASLLYVLQATENTQKMAQSYQTQHE